MYYHVQTDQVNSKLKLWIMQDINSAGFMSVKYYNSTCCDLNCSYSSSYFFLNATFSFSARGNATFLSAFLFAAFS